MVASTSTDRALAGFAEAVGTTGPVAAVGNHTRSHLGGPLEPDTLELRCPTGIVSYQPDEMTVQVRAGTSVADLHAALGEAGQRSALPDRGGTVGGAIAVGENALEVLGRGRLRDSVLQVRYVSAEGEIVASGGPTVKNVSGFNLPKVMVGSLGTLGLVGEVTLRTNPVPALTQWYRADEVDPQQAIDAVLRPGAVLWNGHATWVLLEGHMPDVKAELGRLDRLADFSEVVAPPDLPAHRWSLPPSEVTNLPDRTPSSGNFVALFGVGTVHATEPQPPRSPDQASVEVAARMKLLFDPTGRLAPGRSPI